MNNSEDFIARITAELLLEMPHVARVAHFRTSDSTWRQLARSVGGAEVLEHQFAVNEIVMDMVTEDIVKVRNDYEFQQQSHDPASDKYIEAILALQVIEDYETKSTMVMAKRQAVIREVLAIPSGTGSYP